MTGAAAAVPGRAGPSRRIAVVRWVRRMHGWFGLWGAVLGLMAGLSGIWLNHRAVLKLPLPDQRQVNAQLVLPEPRPTTPEAMAAWLQQALTLPRGATNTRVERSRPVPWAEKGGEGRPPMQPERWQLTFGGPDRLIQAEYWVGNASVALRTTENGFIATLTNLHKGVGVPVAWILLIDTLAGSMIFLSVSGVVLWWETNRRRLVGLAIFGVSVAVTVALAIFPS